MFRDALMAGRTAKPRSLLEFAEAEIIIPTGPFSGSRFSRDTQPFAAQWFTALDDSRWRRFVAAGPVQSGKTLACFVVPVLYELFELNSPVVIAAPSLDTIRNKWERDLLPVIRASRFVSRLPARGAGSGGGKSNLYSFGRGAVLKFMGAKGDDKARASFTARAAFVTETDGMDTARSGSIETDPISQVEARTAAFGDMARMGMECTVGHERGRTWVEYLASTQSRIACPCPHCAAWVTPEREHLLGWRDARNVVEAGRLAMWCCPACAATLSEVDRREMNRAGCLIHHGQEVIEGQPVGDPPETKTLGLRWNAWNNLFVTTAKLGEGEFHASKARDQVSAERGRRQFVWTVPIRFENEGGGDGKIDILDKIDHAVPRGIVPAWCRFLVVGADVGKYAIHWAAKAFAIDASSHTIEYGIQDVDSAALGHKRAILQALRSLRDRVMQGWKTATGTVIRPSRILVDSNYESETTHRFAHESGRLVFATMGRGAGQEGRVYIGPKRRGTVVLRIGDHWHIERVAKEQGKRYLLLFGTDYWKSQLRGRIAAPMGQPGTWTLHSAVAEAEHHSFVKHLSAEAVVREWDSSQGRMTDRWKARRAQNHFLDAEVLGDVAASTLGVSQLREQPPPSPTKTPEDLLLEPLTDPPPERKSPRIRRRNNWSIEVDGLSMTSPLLEPQ